MSKVLKYHNQCPHITIHYPDIKESAKEVIMIQGFPLLNQHFHNIKEVEEKKIDNMH